MNLLAPESATHLRQAIQPIEGQPVPISALSMDQSVFNFKKAAASEAFGVFPFEHSPIAFLNDLDNFTVHFGSRRKFRPEHISDGFFPTTASFGI